MREPFNLLKGKKDLVGAEIGVFRGANAVDILKNLDIKLLHLVDPYEDYVCHGGKLIIGLRDAATAAHKVLDPYRYYINWFEMTSALAVRQIPDNSLDFVYIDGNHRYEYVLEDIAAWTPKVKAGGLVAGHDYTGREGVRRAVDEFCELFKLCAFRAKHGSDWWFIRP